MVSTAALLGLVRSVMEGVVFSHGTGAVP